MITKKQLKDRLYDSERTKVLEQMENYIDKKIKENVLNGRTTFEINTVIDINFWGINKTLFYFLWYSKNLSDDSLTYVRKRILERYTNNGFLVSVTSSNYGKGRDYDNLKFTEVENALEQ